MPLLLVWITVLLVGTAQAAVAAPPQCQHHNPKRNAYFGDLHVHTALSLDAFQQGVRTTPKDAYEFARGRVIPFHDQQVKLARPLDFAAVTDHAEYLGEIIRCTAPDDPLFDSPGCEQVRSGRGAAHDVLNEALGAQTEGSRSERMTRALKVLFESEDPAYNEAVCGKEGVLCNAALESGWQQIIAAAEAAQDRSSACQFSTFIGYEYSGVKTGSNYHRNVIFRNSAVPARPVSYLEAPQDHQLWELLDSGCTRGGAGCEFLAIPHNPNLSNGKLLTPNYAGATRLEAQAMLAERRSQAEPLMEIFQHKGQSECINGLRGIDAPFDPACAFEQVRTVGGTTVVMDVELTTPECGADNGDGGMIDTGCISRNDFLRGALLTGLQEQQRLGVNPLKLGVIASTDTHESTPGAVDELNWRGHVGREVKLEDRLSVKTGLPYRLLGSPGGLAGVWATENSREALFDAMKRRETFGTSGPRIRPRFFAAWSMPENICQASDLLELAYRDGVPMGSDLSAAPGGDAKPVLLAVATRDPESHPLQVLQLIKGWIDREGQPHVRVTDISSGAQSGENVMCAQAVDNEFRPGEAAYYYVRVLEVPGPRWSWAQCEALAPAERPEACINPAPKLIQERAWTSPIWYTPESYSTGR